MNYWIVKGRESRNHFESSLQPRSDDQWFTARPPKNWPFGDRIFFWRSSPHLDVVGLGEFLGRSNKVTAEGEVEFQVRYLSKMLDRPVGIEELRSDPVVSNASFLKSGPSGTIFPVSVEQGVRIYAHVCRLNPLVGDVWSDISTVTQGNELIDIDLLDQGREGERELVEHLRIERNQRLVDAKKRFVLHQSGRLGCEVCGFDFQETYGEPGEGFCEVHHRVPLSSVQGERITNLSDLAVVCSNCHRMLHRDARVSSIQGLQKHLRTVGQRG